MWRAIGVTIGLGAGLTRGMAQAPAAAQSMALTLQQCSRVLTSDSVVFFYDAYYALTPPGCAAIRRHVRLDSTGAFHGEVLDYQLANNILLLKGAYRYGRKEGVFELFYSDGVPAARTRYHAGQPVGDWTYWYHSGQPRQVVRFEPAQPPALQRFWAPDGTLLVADGAGRWHIEEAGTRLEGAIRNGRPDGRWTRRFVRSGEEYAVEYFENGQFRKGSIFYQPAAGQQQLPLDTNQYPFLDVEDFDRTEEWVLGQPCRPATTSSAR